MTWLTLSLAILAGVLIGTALGICIRVWLDCHAMERRWRKAKRVSVLIDAVDKIERLAA